MTKKEYNFVKRQLEYWKTLRNSRKFYRKELETALKDAGETDYMESKDLSERVVNAIAEGTESQRQRIISIYAAYIRDIEQERVLSMLAERFNNDLFNGAKSIDTEGCFLD